MEIHDDILTGSSTDDIWVFLANAVNQHIKDLALKG